MSYFIFVLIIHIGRYEEVEFLLKMLSTQEYELWLSK